MLSLLTILLIGFLPALAGCGEESGADTGVTSPASTGAAANITISGTAVKGPVSGGMVTAYGMSSGVRGAELGSASTDTQGNFKMMVGGYDGPVMLSMTGGTYTDEATGTMMTMAEGDVMTAVIPSVSGGAGVTGIQMTPLTSMAQTMAAGMSGGMSAENTSAANTAMGNYFMVKDILHTPPMNPNVPGSGTGASQDMRNYGMVMAAMMENARMLGMRSSSGMVTAMMNDASDGFMNGMMSGGTQVSMGGGMMGGGGAMMQPGTGTSGMAIAMTTFMNSNLNKSGLTTADMQELLTRLSSASGQVQ